MQLSKADPGSDRDFAEAAEVGYDWLQKWKKRDDAPQERKLVKALSAYLGVSEEWLIDNVGEEPRPELFVEWIAAYRRRPQPKTVREPVRLTKETARIAEDPRKGARKRAAGSHDGRKS
jgi:transcriptional regulator with XRE-family HTH domain